MRQTDGRTPYRYIDPAPHAMRAVSVMAGTGIVLAGAMSDFDAADQRDRAKLVIIRPLLSRRFLSCYMSRESLVVGWQTSSWLESVCALDSSNRISVIFFSRIVIQKSRSPYFLQNFSRDGHFPSSCHWALWLIHPESVTRGLRDLYAVRPTCVIYLL